MSENQGILKLLIFATSVIFLLLMVAFALLLNLLQNRQIRFRDKLSEMNTDYEKSLLNTRIEIQEETLQHISREIHDNIGLSLTLAKLDLNTLEIEPHPANRQKILHSIDLISKSIIDLSNLSRGMNADLIRNNGLLKTLEDEIQRINLTGKTRFELQVQGQPSFLDTEKELILFRIVQEGMNNILKHAQAALATLTFDYTETGLTLRITDNGIGATLQPIAQGSGLLNMQARTRLLNGSFEFNSSPAGTEIRIAIPI